MRVTRATKDFRPITIVLESEEEVSRLLSCIVNEYNRKSRQEPVLAELYAMIINAECGVKDD